MSVVAASDTLRAVIDAGKSSKRLDELSSARVIGKIALLAHAAQQKAGAGKSIGPITPSRVGLSASGETTLDAAATGSTLMYSSPEVVGGGTGDRRSDVFSLGTVMWEALTHQRLFDAMNDAAVKAAVQDREIQPPAEVNANIPAELSAICMRALSRNPADRYQSLKAMAVEIEEFLEEAGYADDDSRIAQYLAAMTRKPASSSVAPPSEKPTTLPLPKPVTTPPATAKPIGTLPSMPRPGASTPPSNAPAQPSILTSEPAKTNSSGAALAAALANAGSSSGLPSISPSATAVGVPAAPVASEWQDKTPKPHVAAPVAAAASEAVSATPNAVSAPIPLVPMPPILPSGSTTAARADKATVLGIVPTPKTNGDSSKVDAKHVEAKPAAQIVEDKPKALIVDDPVEAKANAALADEESKQSGEVAAVKEDSRATLVDTTPPALVNAAADAKAAASEAPKLQTPTAVDAAHAAAKKSDPDDNATKPEAAVAAKVESDIKATTKLEAKTEKTDEKRAKKDTKDTKSEGKRDKKETGPHPASVVSLPGRDSKADVLAGWGWGTDKHDAIAPSGYTPDDEEYEQPNSKKTLTYVIGGGIALALLITIIAFAAGGSKDKKNSAKEKEKQAAIAKAKREDQAALAKAATRETPAPVESGSGSAVVDEASAAKTAAEQKAADEKAAADAKLAEEQAKKDEEAKAKAAAAQATADAEAAAAKVKADAELAKKSDAERKKLEAEAAKAAEAQRKADAKKAAEEAKAAEAAKKAEAKRLAQEEAARKKEEAAAARQAKADAAKAAKEEAARKKAEAAKTAAANTTTTRPKTTKTEPKTVAVAEPKTTKTEPKSDVNPETAYRQGLQAFARGDTTGALASLRSSLAANPNYAPTWRGLGLVFEKMGEKDQAKAAYKRYLQLSPSAGDAEIIKGRLERLGS